MNDPNAFGYQATPGAPTGPERGFSGGPSAMAQYKFSSEEMRVLQECNRESFFKRSVPIATALGLGTFAGIQRGFLKPNPRFGAFPKMTLAVAVGYFIGKLSYQQACAEKLMALPGSYIGQLLRDRRDGKIGGEQMGRSGATSTGAGGMLGAAASDIYSDAGPGSSLDLDTDRPAFTDDTYRPDREGASGGAGANADAAPAQPALSYDELRRRNRGEHADAKQDPYRVEGGVRRAPPPPPPVAPRPPATNRYGDALD